MREEAERAIATIERKEAELPPLLRVWTITRRVVRGLFLHHAFDHAATMAFYFFLGTIPLLVFVSLFVGRVVQREGLAELAGPLYSAMPRAASKLLRSEITEMAEANAESVAPLSMAGFLWLTTNGVHNLMDIFELLVGARPRPWWRQRLISVGWVVGMIAAITITAWCLLAVDGATTELSARHLPTLLKRSSDFVTQGWQRFGVLLVFASMSLVGLAIFYRTSVKHPPGVKRKVWTGTFLALFLWALVSWGFGTYVRTLAHYAVFYGSLATVAVILLWLYLTSLSLVVGAEVNAVLEGMRDDEAPAPTPFSLAPVPTSAPAKASTEAPAGSSGRQPAHSMNVEVAPVRAAEASVLAGLLQLYVYDFSETLGLDVSDDGRYLVPQTEGRDAFLVRVDGKVAGFALHQPTSRLTGDIGVHDMAEFFILQRYRRSGVGEQAACWLFDHFPGRWEVRQRKENARAIAFWRRVIARYTDGRFEEEILDDDRWKGPVQRFDNSRAPRRASEPRERSPEERSKEHGEQHDPSDAARDADGDGTLGADHVTFSAT